MGYVIAIANMKGGVGKTTLTVNLAACLAKNHNKQVLVLDLDSQINATLSLMPPTEFAKCRKRNRTLRYLLDEIISPSPNAEVTINDIITPKVCGLKGLDLLPGDMLLYDEFVVSEMLHYQSLTLHEEDFETTWNRFERILIGNILKPVREKYDFILIDCAPGYNLMTRSALATSDFYIIPAKPEPLSLIGIQLLQRNVAKLKDSHETEAKINIDLLGIVISMSNINNLISGISINSRYHQQVLKRIKQDFGEDKVCNEQIPIDVNVVRAIDSYQPVILFSPNSNGSKAFQKLAYELLQKL